MAKIVFFFVKLGEKKKGKNPMISIYQHILSFHLYVALLLLFKIYSSQAVVPLRAGRNYNWLFRIKIRIIRLLVVRVRMEQEFASLVAPECINFALERVDSLHLDYMSREIIPSPWCSVVKRVSLLSSHSVLSLRLDDLVLVLPAWSLAEAYCWW